MKTLEQMLSMDDVSLFFYLYNGFLDNEIVSYLLSLKTNQLEKRLIQAIKEPSVREPKYILNMGTPPYGVCL